MAENANPTDASRHRPGKRVARTCVVQVRGLLHHPASKAADLNSGGLRYLLRRLVAFPEPWTTLYNLFDPSGRLVARSEPGGELWYQAVVLSGESEAAYSVDIQEMYFFHPNVIGSSTENTNQTGAEAGSAEFRFPKTLRLVALPKRNAAEFETHKLCATPLVPCVRLGEQPA